MTRPASQQHARGKLIVVVVGALLLGGCATFSQDRGFGAVERVAKERLNKDLQWTDTTAAGDSLQITVTKLLTKPLTVEDAVQVALLNNRGLQAMYGELGIAETDLVVLRLSAEAFEHLRATHPALAAKLLHNISLYLAGRLRGLTADLAAWVGS